MKSDEIRFLIMVKTLTHLTPREIMSLPECSIANDKAMYLLKKWHDKGWYAYSDEVDLGKLTIEGFKIAGSVSGFTKLEG